MKKQESKGELGICCAHGEGGTKDAAEAVKWYRKSAEQNCAVAQNNLGGCYFNGQGVAQDYVQAYKWCSLASSQGDENARRNRPFIKPSPLLGAIPLMLSYVLDYHDERKQKRAWLRTQP